MNWNRETGKFTIAILVAIAVGKLVKSGIGLQVPREIDVVRKILAVNHQQLVVAL